MSCAELYEQMLEEGYHEEPDEIEEMKNTDMKYNRNTGMLSVNKNTDDENITVSGEDEKQVILNIKTCDGCCHKKVCKIRETYENKFRQIQKSMEDICMDDENSKYIRIDIKCNNFMTGVTVSTFPAGNPGVFPL